MANTIVVGTRGFTVTFDGSTDWDLASSSGLTNDLPNGVAIRSIQIIPSAADDIITIREVDATGRVIMKSRCLDVYDQKIKYFSSPTDQRHQLFVKGSEASSGVMMIVEY